MSILRAPSLESKKGEAVRTRRGKAPARNHVKMHESLKYDRVISLIQRGLGVCSGRAVADKNVTPQEEVTRATCLHR
jgi:hypothetical protein